MFKSSITAAKIQKKAIQQDKNGSEIAHRKTENGTAKKVFFRQFGKKVVSLQPNQKPYTNVESRPHSDHIQEVKL